MQKHAGTYHMTMLKDTDQRLIKLQNQEVTKHEAVMKERTEGNLILLEQSSGTD